MNKLSSTVLSRNSVHTNLRFFSIYHQQNKTLRNDFSHLYQHDPGFDLEAPISTNHQICYASIKKTRQYLLCGKTDMEAKVTPNSLTNHHLLRLESLKEYYGTLICKPSTEEIKQQLDALTNNLSGVVFHQDYNHGFRYTNDILSDILKQSGGICIGQALAVSETNWEIKNPFNPLRSVWGRSGAAATSIALGIGNVAIVDDCGDGSISISCGFTGTVGIKPSSNTKVFGGNSCGSTGTVTRTLEDAALVWDLLIPLERKESFSQLTKLCKSYDFQFKKARIGCISQYPKSYPLDICITHSFSKFVESLKEDFVCTQENLQISPIPGTEIENIFKDLDFLIAPITSNSISQLDQYFRKADCPVITIPLGEDDSFVPFGVQTVGKPQSGVEGLYELFGFVSTLSKYINYQPELSITALKYSCQEDNYGFSIIQNEP